jgi:hypothetical protein
MASSLEKNIKGKGIPMLSFRIDFRANKRRNTGYCYTYHYELVIFINYLLQC